LIYSDDILVVSHDQQAVMSHLTKAYTLKEGSVAPPTTYLGADVQQQTFKDATDPTTTRWSMSSDTYIKRAIVDVGQHLGDIGETLVKQQQPICGDYRPELDGTPLLNDS
jgi:hypothetical protein